MSKKSALSYTEFMLYFKGIFGIKNMQGEGKY